VEAQKALIMASNWPKEPDRTAAPAAEQATVTPATPSTLGIGRLRRIEAAAAFGSTSEQLRIWLARNMDAVGEVTGHAWAAAVADRSASGAPTSLIGTAPEGRAVFEADPSESSSESLGRLITALVESGATTGVWLAADPRPEHVAAVAWLNASSEASFYFIQLEAVRIDDSAPAPWMTLVVRPGRDESEDSNMPAPVEAASSVAVPPAAEPDSATVDAADETRESSTLDDLVGDTGRRADDWRRIALRPARPAE
jgi:hypothetical protein